MTWRCDSSVWPCCDNDHGKNALDHIEEIVRQYTSFPVRIRTPAPSKPNFRILEIMDFFRIHIGSHSFPILTDWRTKKIPGKIDYFAVFQSSYEQFDLIFSLERHSVHRETISGYQMYEFVNRPDSWAKRRFGVFEFWCREEEEERRSWWIEVDDPIIKGPKKAAEGS